MGGRSPVPFDQFVRLLVRHGSQRAGERHPLSLQGGGAGDGRAFLLGGSALDDMERRLSRKVRWRAYPATARLGSTVVKADICVRQAATRQ